MLVSLSGRTPLFTALLKIAKIKYEKDLYYLLQFLLEDHLAE